MKNPAPYVREQLFSLLNGAVEYDAEPVPVYTTEGKAGDPYQILILGQTGSPENTKDSLTSQYSLIIEVVSEGHSFIRKHIDHIANDVLGLVKPTPRTHAIENSADWTVTNVEFTPPRYIEDIGGSGSKINRLILEMNYKITEK